MAPKTVERPVVNDDLDDFGVDDFNPIVNSGDEQSQSKKRDAAELGIDEAVAVTKKQRRPNVKLDEERLLSDKGLPKLRRKAAELKFKGKGHEFSDAARLLSFYQLWLDDLFPKAKFLDALAMVEKCGHKNRVRMKRLEIIDEGKPKSTKRFGDDDDDERDRIEGRDAAKFPAQVAPIFQTNSADARQKTPTADSLFGDNEDIYDATPKRLRPDGPADMPPSATVENDTRADEPDEDELDALMAEEEAQRAVPTSLFGNGSITQKSTTRPPGADDDLDAIIAEAEVDTSSTTNAAVPVIGQEDDELDALMAETESQERIAPEALKERTSKANQVRSGDSKDVDADEEEAMAEMDGLW